VNYLQEVLHEKRLIGTLISTLVGLAPTIFPATTSAEAPAPSAKTVACSEKYVVPAKAKIRFTTLIVLSKSRSKFSISRAATRNSGSSTVARLFAHVKPAKAGSRTNLNLITASGNVYSFVLTEVSDAPDSEPDLRILVEPKDEWIVSAANGQPRFVNRAAGGRLTPAG
jgi:type IV secretion system protein VirB9